MRVVMAAFDKRDMFASVKRRFLTLHMVILSLLLIGILLAVLVVTWRTSLLERWELLEHRSAKQPMWEPAGEGPARDFFHMQTQPEGRNPGAPPDMTQVFDVFIDENGEVLMTNSLFIQDEEGYLVMLDAALADGKDRGELRIGNTYWLYIRRAWDGPSCYSFLDITQQLNILSRLAVTLGLVACGALVLVYFLSRLFAERAIRPMRETWDRQNQFLLDASHELRTPLTVIAANVDLVLTSPEETVKSQRKWLGYVRDEAERMTGLTNDLLWIARHDVQRDHATFAKVDFSAIAANAATGMEVMFFEKGIEFDARIQPEIYVNGISQQLEQAALVLLDNAYKYTEAGGEVTLSVQGAGKDVVLAVSSTGEPIADEHQTRIFDRFYRTDSARDRRSGGYGLGLSIARAIVERHGGRITVRSAAGKNVFAIAMRVCAK